MRHVYHTIDEEFNKFALICSIIFLIFPIVGVSLSIIGVINNKEQDKRYLWLVFSFLSLYMGAINATKIPMSDQVGYFRAYTMVPQNGFIGSLMNIYGSEWKENWSTKEMGYGFLNYIGYYFSFGNYQIFIMLFTAILYMLYFHGINKFYNYIYIRRNRHIYILSAIILLSFFTQFFNLTIHIQRQMIASAFMFYALVLMVEKQKIPWIPMIFACTLHTTMMFFVPFFFIRFLLKPLKIRYFILVISLMAVCIISAPNAAMAIISEGTDSYALKRLAYTGNSDNIGLNLETAYIVFIPLCFICLKNMYLEKKYLVQGESFIYMVFLILTILVFCSTNSTVQYRFMMASYGFIALFLPLLFRRNTEKAKIYILLISIFFVLRFYITFDAIIWKYAPVESILFDNFFSLLFYRC